MSQNIDLNANNSISRMPMKSLFLRSFKTIPLILSGSISFHCDPSGTQFIFLAERVYNFVALAARGSREDRKATAISLWSEIFLSVWYPQLPSNKPYTNSKDAIKHDVIVHFGFSGNAAGDLGSFYSSSVYCTFANRKVFLRQITAGCQHNSARLDKWPEVLTVGVLTPKERWPELQLACESIRFFSLFAAWEVTRNVPSGEEQGETDAFAG